MCLRYVRLVVAGLLIALAMAGCGYSSGSMNGPMPLINSLMPNAVVHGSATFPMTVTGSNFGADAVVYFNGNVLQTTYQSTTQVTAQVLAADVAASGMVAVYVRTNGQNSNSVGFSIQ